MGCALQWTVDRLMDECSAVTKTSQDQFKLWELEGGQKTQDLDKNLSSTIWDANLAPGTHILVDTKVCRPQNAHILNSHISALGNSESVS